MILSGCASYSDNYYTYILQNRYNIYETNNERESKIELFSHNYRYYDLVFEILLNSQEENGLTPSGYSKYNYTGPYDLIITIESYFTNWIKNGKTDTGRGNDIDLNKIIFNKITLYKKGKPIDLLDKIILNGNNGNFEKKYPIGVSSPYSPVNIFDDDDTLLFRNHGIINLAKQRESKGYIRQTASLFLENIDVNYNKDISFNLELEITLEKDNGESENKIITAKYKRKKITKLKERAFLNDLL